MNKEYAYILYDKRSSVTGRALFEVLRDNNVGGYIWRRSSDGNFAKKPTLVLRWGSAVQVQGDFKELNTREAVRAASAKLEMMNKLIEDKDVPTPTFSKTLAPVVDGNGYAYIRDSNNKVRFDNRVQQGDKYCLAPIDKVAEYRIHVFDGKTMGVYQKIPHTKDVRMYKDDNCDFVRVDQANKKKMQALKGARPAAVAATKALGLLHSGVDAMIDANGNVFINEVNSAPALNEPNLERWVNRISEYLKGGKIVKNNEQAQTAQLDEEERQQRMREQVRRRDERNEQRAALRERVIEEIRQAGFEPTRVTIGD